MKRTFQKFTAILLALVQLFLLCPVFMPAAMAVETESETPALNETIVGTVQFQSFNFLGDNVNGVDGTDYSTTFYYSDDYFSPSAINSAADKRTMLWSDLDNKALATCSMDFAVAAMTSAKDDVLRATSETWNNSEYDRVINDGAYSGKVKERNVREFLSACGFTGIECTDLDKRPTNDSIGYTLASKEITVWNADTEKNETYTLVAVGVRGAGYGQEWASNVTIGNPETGKIPANGRHYGFDWSAQKVCSAIETYLGDHSITGNVKYWVTGFSRAAAVANLVSGYLTDGGNQYKTQPRDVYGYTWECPQAAKKTDSPDTNFTNYKNIHNILNPMDAVPKVSPDAFEHQRLGVDYQMPYHGNVTSIQQNETLYSQMYNVLKTIATGCEYTGKADPLIETVDPSNYPYKTPITIYTVYARDLMTQLLGYAAASDKENTDLMKKFGTREAEQEHGLFGGNVESLLGWNGKNDYKTSTWYLDKFIDELVKVFLTSNAWVGGVGTDRTALQNRATFISDFQPHFRTLFGYFLDYAGPAFLDLVPNLIDAVSKNIGSSLLSEFPADFILFYASPTSTTIRNRLIKNAKPIVHNVIDSMTDVGDGFPDPEYQGITKQQAKDAMDALVPLVIDLYAFEKSHFDSQYLGTTLRYLNTILCTHEQETVMSWIMSLDPNHINRSCRTLTVPLSADVTLYEFREKYGEVSTDGETTAPIVATLQNGEFTLSKDQRITRTISGNSVIIRYPASLDIRADVTATSDFTLSTVSVKDYQTKTAYEKVSAGAAQFSDGLPTASYSAISASKTNASAANTSLSRYGTLEQGDRLHILVNDLATYNSENESTQYTLSIDKKPTVAVADFAAKTLVASSYTGSLPAGTDSRFKVEGGALYWYGAEDDLSNLTAVRTGSSVVNETKTPAVAITTRKTFTVVPASSIYYDDDLNGQTFTSDGHGYSANINDDAVSKNASAVSGSLFFTFYGTGIDIYCTTHSHGGYASAALYAGSDTTGTRLQTISVKNQSDGDYYNTPTIRFTGLKQDTYTVWLYANEAAQYKLDGVRVYDPVQKGTAAADAQAAAGEGNVLYLNLHDLLLNADQGFSVNPVAGMSDDFDKSAISGVLFVDNADAIVTESHYDADGVWHEAMTQLYATQFEAYKANSPKNEIYLSGQQAITFQVNTAKAAPGSTIYIGMSAPQTGSGSVSITGSGTKPVTSVMDMYYGITVPSNGSITIKNEGGSLISLTNLKIPNVADADEITALPAAEKKLALRAFFAPVTTETVELAAAAAAPEEAVVPEEPVIVEETPTPDPTPAPTPDPIPDPTPTPTPTLADLFSNFILNIFRGIGRLFGR